jgi:hypothetical protein
MPGGASIVLAEFRYVVGFSDALPLYRLWPGANIMTATPIRHSTAPVRS